MDAPTPPKVFANRVLEQIVHHMVGEDMVIEFDDYHVIRTAFRSAGGSWDKIAEGDIVQLELLKRIVTAWGQMPGRRHESDRMI